MPEPTKIDVAAGGLLERGNGESLRIAVVHRGRYDDWTLPKGHLEEGETIEQAAIREVREETGCTGEITEIVQPVSYLVSGQPKIVVYYRMRLVHEGAFRPDDEVSAIEWMTPAEACEKLSYASEQQVVAGAYPG
ncbi:MAG: NUDIX hydrolase [Chloroflexi bacterium]|nr:NUDIX hydrolase [Chloroflexota bacterium]